MKAMRKIFLTGLGILLITLVPAQNKEQLLTVMFYNVENLFDTERNPDKLDSEFTPESEKAWDMERYEKKLDDIASVIKAVNKAELPEIVGLCEVENLKVLEDLIRTRDLKRGNYGIVHYESPDARGIDCALLYNMDEFRVIASEAIPVTFPFDSTLTTRDILYVEGKTRDNESLHLLINHWSSRSGGERETEPKRLYCAVTLRKKVDRIFNREPGAKIIIMGDLNDEPTSRSVFEILMANNKRKNAGDRELYNLMYDAHNAGTEGSYNYRGTWNMLDQIIVSRTVLSDSRGWHTGYDGGHILKADFMLYHDEDRQDYVPNRTYGGPNYYGGISDHLPVYVTLVKEK
jgi:endonuclease/exonuclease/phosphatase family metal-dependent hydrolase